MPKRRRKTLYTELRRQLSDVFRQLASQMDTEIFEHHLMADHVHMMIATPPRHAVSQAAGFIKGKSAA